MAYLLDANVFIQAKNLHYGLDFCPAFWEWLIAGNQAKRVFSIEKICIGLSIKCMSPYEMLRRERALFILGSRK